MSTTIRHMHVKALLRHIEFGTSDGRPLFSCKFIQKANIGMRTAARQRRAIFAVCSMALRSPEMALGKVCQHLCHI